MNIDNFEGQLYGLSRSGIHHGDVTSIPKDTLAEIRKVASYIHDHGLWTSS
ncbi:hypothetical protein [Metallosphaera javensis (ex Sakai et al. 2022)]|uniref:hypothetical protein n=1 Tax=Metallosphaera javensis (ex Sakai et al. 2022) TaxID=2775498 RepID=UPI00258BFCB1|nr:MAG: hypothetical protein MjAS7_2102 [Metallosphaera javensis (ex Sakai et al. 2022)]